MAGASSSNGRPAEYILSGGTVLDGSGGPVRQNCDIHIRAGKVVALGQGLRTGENVPRESAHGKWITPGLIDTHFHYTFPPEFSTYVRNGVTAIRFAGTGPGVVEEVRTRLERSHTPSPRIFSCGPMIDAFPPSYPELSVVVRTPEEARSTARRLIDETRVDSLLVVQHMTAELTRPIVQEAHAAGLPAFGQTWDMDAFEAAEVGLDQLDNTSRVLVSSEVSSTRARSYKSIGERAGLTRKAWATIDWDMTDRMIDAMVQHGVAYCPTLIRTQWRANIAPGTMRILEKDRDFAAFDPEHIQLWQKRLSGYEWNAGLSPAEIRAEDKSQIDAMLEWIRRFHTKGGRVVAGSDSQFGGIMLHGELDNLRMAGLSPLEVLFAATGSAAQSLGPKSTVGVLAPGMEADYLVLSEDPLTRLVGLRTPDVVVQGGRIVHSNG